MMLQHLKGIALLILISCLFLGCGADEEESHGQFPVITLREIHSEGEYRWLQLQVNPASTRDLSVLVESRIRGKSSQDRDAGYTWLGVGRGVPEIEFGLALNNAVSWDFGVMPLSEVNLNLYAPEGTEAADYEEFPKYHVGTPAAANRERKSGPKPKFRKPIYLDLTPLPPDPNAPEGMARISQGEFQMGGTVEENEKPLHTVFIDAFYLDKYEITNAQYKKFVDANPSFSKENFPIAFHDGNYLDHWNDGTYPTNKGAHPVTYVSWYAAAAYARWIGKRLPTEAEWEKAARSGLPGTQYIWGNAVKSEAGNYAGAAAESTPVGRYLPNRYGVYDLAGNVREWCLDEYDATFYGGSPRENPIAGADTIPEALESYFTDVKSPRVLRGGSWRSTAPELRVASRPGQFLPTTTAPDIGFRCMRPVPTSVPKPVTYTKAFPVAGSRIEANETLTFNFDAPPKDVSVNTGTVTTDGKIVTLTGTFATGALPIVLTWGDGIQVLNYTVRAPVHFVSVSPQAESTIEADDTITLTFDGAPQALKVNTGTATIVDKTVTITGPFAYGALNLEITWADGTEKMEYTVRRPVTFVSVDPAVNNTIAADTEITLQFNGVPSSLKVSKGTIRHSGSTVTVTGPFVVGALNLQVTWRDGTRTLRYTVRETAAITAVSPAANSSIETHTIITVQFNHKPQDVRVSKGTYQVVGNTVRITGPFTIGVLNLQITWADGTEAFIYIVRESADFVSVSPKEGSTIETDTPITLRFANTPQDLQVTKGSIQVTGKTATIKGPFTPGPLSLEIKWNHGERTLDYTVRTPVTFISASPKSGSTIEIDTPITLRFDDTPKNVHVSKGTMKTSGNTVTITGPFATGALNFEVTWDDGKLSLAYTVRKLVKVASVSPRTGMAIEPDATITVNFDTAPTNVRVSGGKGKISGETLTITGPFASGTLNIRVTWDGGNQTLQYTVDTSAPLIVEPPSTEQTPIPDTSAPPVVEPPSTGKTLVSVEPAEAKSPAVGQRLTVRIRVTNGKGVAGYQLTVGFDQSALRYVSSTDGTYFLKDVFTVPPTANANSVTVRATLLSGVATATSGTLATVTFEVVSIKRSTLQLKDVTLAGADARPLEIETRNGVITTAAVPSGGQPPANNNIKPSTESMVFIPAGEFQMGRNTGGSADEKPVHTVYVDAFYIDTYEVTNEEYKVFLLANPQWQKGNVEARFHDGNYLRDWKGNTYPAGKDDHPVVNVSWYAAMAYATWAGKRLPTEAEWEKAARGGLVGKTRPWGNTIDTTKANYNRNVGNTTPVQRYDPNPYGLYNMVGNVSEWCLDKGDAAFYARSPRSNPFSGGSIANVVDNFTNVSGNRVRRGGSYLDPEAKIRVADRTYTAPTLTHAGIGFRCVNFRLLLW